LTSGG